jgi:hypothetical protein
MVGCFILLFVNDTGYSDPKFIRDLDEPDKHFHKRENPTVCVKQFPNCKKKYPCMCIVHCKGFYEDMVRFVSDRRSLYNKWRSGDRDPQDYMSVYRYLSDNQTDSKNLIINSVMVGAYSTSRMMLDTLKFLHSSYLTEYRTCFVDENIQKLTELLAKTKERCDKPKPFEKELKSCLDEPVELNYCVKITRPVVAVGPLLPVRPAVPAVPVVANKRKTSQQRYREAHKEDIKERNRLYYLRCKAEIENAATSDAS